MQSNLERRPSSASSASSSFTLLSPSKASLEKDAVLSPLKRPFKTPKADKVTSFTFEVGSEVDALLGTPGQQSFVVEDSQSETQQLVPTKLNILSPSSSSLSSSSPNYPKVFGSVDDIIPSSNGAGAAPPSSAQRQSLGFVERYQNLELNNDFSHPDINSELDCDSVYSQSVDSDEGDVVPSSMYRNNPPHAVIMHCNSLLGLDASALDILDQISLMCRRSGCELVFAALGDTESELLRRAHLLSEGTALGPAAPSSGAISPNPNSHVFVLDSL